MPSTVCSILEGSIPFYRWRNWRPIIIYDLPGHLLVYGAWIHVCPTNLPKVVTERELALYAGEFTESVTTILKLRLQNYEWMLRLSWRLSGWTAAISELIKFWCSHEFVEEERDGRVVSRPCGKRGLGHVTRVAHSKNSSWESSRSSQRAGGTRSLHALNKWQRLIPLAEPSWFWARVALDDTFLHHFPGSASGEVKICWPLTCVLQ